MANQYGSGGRATPPPTPSSRAAGSRSRSRSRSRSQDTTSNPVKYASTEPARTYGYRVSPETGRSERGHPEHDQYRRGCPRSRLQPPSDGPQAPRPDTRTATSRQRPQTAEMRAEHEPDARSRVVVLLVNHQRRRVERAENTGETGLRRPAAGAGRFVRRRSDQPRRGAQLKPRFQLPDRVVGRDGRERPATRPSTCHGRDAQRPGPSAGKPPWKRCSTSKPSTTHG